MPSSFNWVDFAEDDRQKMMEILHLFHEKEIREELGIGTVRDAFSDILFPGTSTLHTRAKYMLFIPWISLYCEEKRIPSEKVDEYSRGLEIRLIKALLEAGEEDGVIGRVAQDNLKILPSYMYWSGLGIWGIRKFEGTKYQYFQSLDSYYFYKKSAVKSDDNELVMQTGFNWDPHIVRPPKEFPYKASLDLNVDEAEYLHHRIKANCKDSILAFLVDQKMSMDVAYVWLHPRSSDFLESHKIQIRHAKNFSDVMHGASLLYNLMLSEKRKNEEWIEKYSKRIRNWASDMKDNFVAISSWDLNEFWKIVYAQNSHVHYMTPRFIDNWIEIVKGRKGLTLLIQNEDARRLIYHREARIKGKRSRLKNPRMLEQWSGAAGVNPLDFRWHVAKRLVNDILSGLKGK